ncbi:MAG: hypothetical protein ACP5MG_13685 [Verrucomicrobiia bacterium]|jgi:hypothetical protein
MKYFFNKRRAGLIILLWIVCGSYGTEKVIYRQNFETASIGSLPDGMVALDGKFSVKEEKGNRYLELQGVPLEEYAVFFGEELDGGAEISARIRGESTGKRTPSFCVGLYGTGGIILRVSPGRGAVELFKGKELKASAPFEWKGDGKWVWLKLRVIPVSASRSVISGMVWYESNKMENQPDKWQIRYEAEKPDSGKAFVIAIPYSSKPIHFDDITLIKIERE